MKKIMFLLFLATGVIGCSVESLDTNEELLTADFTFEDSNLPIVSLEIIDDKDKVKGMIYVTNDCDNLYIQIEEAEDVNLQLSQDDENFPNKNNNGHVPPGGLDYDQTTGYSWTFSLSDFSEGVNIFANAGGSSWSGDLEYGNARYFYYKFQLDSCEEVCTYGKGWWKNHSNDNPGEQDDLWPVDELMLGNNNYNQGELNDILDVPNNEGNNLIIFSHHLIAAKLNVKNGAGNTEIEAIIEEADELIGDLVVLEDAFSDDQKTDSNTLKAILEAFNESNPCDEDE